MPDTEPNRCETSAPPLPAVTHADAAYHLSRPFAPGAIGFRAVRSAPLNGDRYGGAKIAAYITAQSVSQRLNAVVPGRWRMEPAEMPTYLTHELHEATGQLRPTNKRYLGCRLTIWLPDEPDGEVRAGVYEDIGAMDAANSEGLKTLYSDARKRVAVAAGVGAYLYTALNEVILRQVNADQVTPDADLTGWVVAVWPQGNGAKRKPHLMIPDVTEAKLRDGYARRIASDAAKRDLGEVLSHGEPETGIGQGEAAEEAAPPQAAEQPAPNAPAATMAGEVAVGFPAFALANGAAQ